MNRSLVTPLISDIIAKKIVSQIKHNKKFVDEMNKEDRSYNLYHCFYYGILPSDHKRDRKSREDLCALCYWIVFFYTKEPFPNHS